MFKHLEQCWTCIKNHTSVCWYDYYYLKECLILFMIEYNWGSMKVCLSLCSLSHPCTMSHTSRLLFGKQVVIYSCKLLMMFNSSSLLQYKSNTLLFSLRTLQTCKDWYIPCNCWLSIRLWHIYEAWCYFRNHVAGKKQVMLVCT